MAETDGNKSGHKISGRFLHYGETCICNESKGWSDEYVYRTRLGEIWEDLTAFLDRNQIKNFSIWNVEQLISGYYENEDGMKLSEDEKAAKDSMTEKIQDTFETGYQHLEKTCI